VREGDNGTYTVAIEPTIAGPDAPVKKGERPTQEAPVKPDYVPDQFWKDGKIDHEGLAKSYTELRKKLDSKPAAPAGEQKPAEKPAEQKPAASEQKPEDKPNGEQTPKADAASTVPGVTAEQTAKYTKEIAEGGKLSDTSYEELAKAGYPKTVVDAYLRGIQADQAAAEAQISEVKKIAGGDEGYSAMADWMANNLSEAELTEYNELVNSGKTSVIKHAVKSMHERYTEAMGGQEPKLLGGKPNGPTGEHFRSNEELKQAMKDPRYKKDNAYRKEVEAKLARSKF
jgi:hypothetical protein